MFPSEPATSTPTLPLSPIGIFSHIAPGSDEQKAASIAAAGFDVVQLVPPKEIDEQQLRQTIAIYRASGVDVVALSGYTNLMDQDQGRLRAGLSRLKKLLRIASAVGCPAVCTETGTTDPTRRRVDFPADRTVESWRLCLDRIASCRDVAAQHGSTLNIEAYVKNVVSSLSAIEAMFSELGHEHLGLVLDPFNLFREPHDAQNVQVMSRICSRLAPFAVVAHAKDWAPDAEVGIATPRAGQGVANWIAYGECLSRDHASLPLILEHLRWDEVPETLAFVRQQLVTPTIK